jgi:hypothetical protein
MKVKMLKTTASRPSDCLPPKPRSDKDRDADISRLYAENARLRVRLDQVVELLVALERLHHGQQGVMRSFSDKISAGIDKDANRPV